MWWAGIPFLRIYPPALHYAVAVLSSGTGISVSSAYHVITALVYSLGGVTFYYLTMVLSGSRTLAFWSALVFSLFSPSTLLFPAVRHDVGGFLNPRRFQALVYYGEGPNVTGLTVAMLALALLHLALRKRTARSMFFAALAIAALPLTNWTSTMALLMGLVCYFAAQSWKEFRAHLPQTLMVGGAAAAFALPFAPPSAVWTAFHDANQMADAPTPGHTRWILAILLVACLVAVRAALIHKGARFAIRFALMYVLLMGGIVLADGWMRIRIIPYPMRFHLAMEIAMTLAAAFVVQSVFARWPVPPRIRCILAAAAIALICTQAIHYRQYVHTIVRRGDFRHTIEYEQGRWFDENLHGRVLVPGSTSFWMNIFTETPQMTGCCDQSLTNPSNQIAAYISYAGYQSDAESADYSLLWMKAYAVQAVAIGGPNSREYYKDFRFPQRFRERLSLIWSRGDDFIYRVPERAPGLARVVRASDLVKHLPQNGIDADELRHFAGALDNSALPIASFNWESPNDARISGDLQPEHLVELAINYDSGWSASANGRVLTPRADGLGFIVLDPRCSGACEIRLHWSAGWEGRITIAGALAVLIGFLFASI